MTIEQTESRKEVEVESRNNFKLYKNQEYIKLTNTIAGLALQHKSFSKIEKLKFGTCPHSLLLK